MPDPSAPVAPVEPAAPADDAAPAGPSPEMAADLADGDQENAPPKKPAPPAKQKIKFKTKGKDGAEVEEEFDEDVIAGWRKTDAERKSHIRAANEKFREAQALHDKEIAPLKARLAKLKENPQDVFDLLREQGIDPTEAAARYAEKVLAEQLTQRLRAGDQGAWEQIVKEHGGNEQAARAYAARLLGQPQQDALAKREAEIAAREEAIAAEQHQRDVYAFQQEFAKALPPVLTKYGLPDNEQSAKRIGGYIAEQIRSGQPIDADAAADLYSSDVDEMVTHRLSGMKPGEFAQKYPEIAKRLREEDAASMASPRPVRPVGKQPVPPPAQKRPLSWREEVLQERDARFFGK